MPSRQMTRYYKMRNLVIDLLGGHCQECNETDNLEIDHINQEDKSFDPGKFFNLSLEKIKKEISKCQLLCKDCHLKKTLRDRGQKPAKGTHGTLSSYRYCHCELCKKAMRDWTREYRKRKTSDC